MVNDLLKLASAFHKLSQDPMAAVNDAVDNAIKQFPNTSVKTVSLIGNDVKVDIDITKSASKGVTREALEKVIKPAVQKINPAFQVTVIVSMSSEETLPKSASQKKKADCQAGDPMCPDIGDFKADPINPSKPSSKPAPKPTPKPVPKPDVNKADDGLPADIKSALDNSVQGAKGSIRLDVNGKTVVVRYNLNRIRLGNAKVKEIIAAALAPLGYEVVECYGETNVSPNY